MTPLPRRLHPLIDPRRIFYGWWIVFSASMLAALAGGVYFFGFTAFFLPLKEDLGVSRGTLSSIVAVASLEGGVLGPLQGYMIDRFGPRRIMYFGVTAMGLGFILISTAQSIVPFAIYFILFIAVGAGMGMFSPAFAAVGNWFVKRRGTAFGITMSGFGLGAVLVIFTNFLVESLGWRGAAVTIGLVIWGVGFPLATLIRHRPEQYGMLPDGAQQPEPSQDTPTRQETDDADFTAKEALKTPAFWWLHLSFAGRTFIAAAVALHFIPAMESKDFSSGTAAALLSLFGIIGIPARLGVGVLGDFVDKRLVGGVMAGLMALSMLIFVWADALWQVILFIAIYAVSSGGGGSLMFAIRGDYFGRKAFATITGFGSSIMMIGSVLGPTFMGFSFDATDSYDLAFYVFSAVGAASAIAMLLAKRPYKVRVERPMA